MQLHAAIVPPSSVVQAALEAARVVVSPPAPPAQEQRPRLLDRVLGRREAEAPPAPPDLTLVEAPPGAAHVRLAKFGNVTSTDAGALADALADVAGTWPVPVVYVTHLVVGKTYPFEVTARLEGDLDALRGLHRNVNEVAQSQGFFLDRRSFRTELVLGTVQTADYGSSVPVAGIEVPCRGPYWSPSHVTLLRSSFAAGVTTFAEYARIDLADGAEERDARTGG